MKKLTFLTIAMAAVAAPPPAGLKWIAHRGGVVDEHYPENGAPTLEAAVKHGYWMIESDIRETKDGKIITQHDPDFKRFYGDPRKAGELTLREVKALTAKPGGGSPLTFTELVDLCKGRLRLMLDTKEPSHPAAFYDEMERELRRTGLLESAYVIGTEESRKRFLGKARVGVSFAALEAAVKQGEDVARRYFLFEHGNTLTEAQVRFAQQKGVPVVPSVNTFHYSDIGQDPMKNGTADIRRLIPLGVTEFQIDSVYEPAFRQ